MSWHVRLKPLARAEYDEALDWYSLNRPTQRDDLEAAVEAVFSSLAANPLKHQKVKGEIRRAVVRKFPYVVFYIPVGRTVQVISVFHARQNPTVWQSRV